MRMQVVRGPVPCGPFEIHDGDNFIGRAPECEVCLPSKKVSRRHASITVREGRAVVKDLESHNGVVDADGRRVAVLPLPPGQKVQIGDFLLVLDGPAAEDDLDLDAEEDEEVDLDEEPVPLPKARRGPPDPGSTGMSPLARPSMPPPVADKAPRKVSNRPAREVAPPAPPEPPPPVREAAPPRAPEPPPRAPEPAPRPPEPAPRAPEPARPSARPAKGGVQKETISLEGVKIRPPEPEEAAAAAAVAEPRPAEPPRTAAPPRVPEPPARAPSPPEAPTVRQELPPPEPPTLRQEAREPEPTRPAPRPAEAPTQRQDPRPAEPADVRSDARRRSPERPAAPVALPRFEPVEVPSTGVPWALQAFLIFATLWAVVVCAPMGGLFSQKWAADGRLAAATEAYAFQVGTTLAERNAQALLDGDRTLLDLSYATSVPGVVEARVADARGMVLAPEEKYRISLGSREVYQQASGQLGPAKADAGGSTVEIVVPARRSVGGEIVGWAFLVVDLQEMGKTTAAPWWWWVPSVVVVLIVTVLLAVAPWWLFVRPLTELAGQVDRVAGSESGTLRPTTRLRPLERIVFAFNGVLVQARSGRQ